ncbi:hypothetical protein [Acidaminobacter hydrogenoformans]|uniref:Uncharacterized protein n=1 Tax=Acidaminobacter hydrogenoformans DSM 2784 TaxID=1120920 RepID=A0A1G5S128_9FIRM|nr:hypothetical protein [Acidaminobacter hydrogenoformans]SCZ79848.1 hypothetical protein SAMN03080599_01973 [Acidaminobacter hydrogenoformans DSM 2784]
MDLFLFISVIVISTFIFLYFVMRFDSKKKQLQLEEKKLELEKRKLEMKEHYQE